MQFELYSSRLIYPGFYPALSDKWVAWQQSTGRDREAEIQPALSCSQISAGVKMWVREGWEGYKL